MNTRLHPRLITVVALALSVAALTACFPPADLPRGGSTSGSATSGAASASQPSTSQTNTIEGDWQLVSVGGTPAIAGSEATMLLAIGKASGTTGCNRYNGSYELSGADRIKFGMLAMTQMACAEPVMVQEQAFTKALASATTYSVSQTVLTLKDASGAALATFQPRQAISLTGTTWTAIGINNGKQAVVSIAAGTEITAIFGADGALSGKAGCNQYSASYTVDGNKMTISQPISTRMYCGEPAGVMEQEQAYLATLTKVATYSIDGDRLELRAADGALQADYTAKP
jgi:heat shock protein HslJ